MAAIEAALNPRLFTFVGGDAGPWQITRIESVVGETIATASYLEITSGPAPDEVKASWALRGVTSNERYVTREEKNGLVARQPSLGRLEAICGALIPIRKSPEWWALTQDERRRTFEDQSNHVRTGMQFLPAVARRLHHCRDLSADEPFDFLTWFEYAPSDESAFDDLLGQLRSSPEWKYVSREVDIRVVQTPKRPRT